MGGTMSYIIHYDIAALIIAIIVLLFFYFRKTIETRQNRIFATFIFLAIISNISDLISIFIITYSGIVPRWIEYLVNETYLASFNGTAVAYFVYTIYLTKNKNMSILDAIRAYVPYAIVCVLIFTSDFTKLVFYFDESGEYTHGPLIVCLYASAFYYIVSSLLQSVIYHKILSKSQFWTVVFFTATTMGAISLQMYIDGLLIVQFMISVSLLLIYLTLENPENYWDKMLESYNNLAFMEVFKANVNREKKFTVLGIQVDGLKFINENLGVSAGNQLMKEIATYLKTYVGRKNVYHMSGAQFTLMSAKSDFDWDEILKSIAERFNKPFMYGEMEISLNTHMCILNYPDTVTRLEDAIDMIEYSLKKSKVVGDGTVVYADQEILEKGKRENSILQALTQAVREDAFDVYYQPIYSVTEERYTTAEALVRLQNEHLGFISPEEFIPIAEKNGLIIKIGELVFDRVCNFYVTNHLEEKGIDSLHFNLSVVECMQDRLYEKLIAKMDKYNLEYKRISLEITETAAVASKDTLRNNMQKLIDKGMKFSMDDYGTGFSNTATIITYPFDEIKIDKSIVWSSMEDSKAMTAFKHTVAMMKELNLKIVAEGVETQEQAQMLKEMGCDYFQGYLYSKPVNGKEFLTKIDS